jgi:hypothetical protein
VDGRNVTDLEQLLHPGPEIRPVRFREWRLHNFCDFYLPVSPLFLCLFSSHK